jgi:hypothetical protein
MGRHRMPADKKKSKKLSLNLSEEELDDLYKAAALDDLKPYIWGRRELMRAVRARLKPAKKN